jgi:hypothetical protein
MKSIIKLAIAGLIAYAAWNVATAWLTYIKFKDAVTEVSQYGEQLSEAQLREKVMSAASEYSVPIDEESFTVRKDAETHHTYIDGAYTQKISVLPWYAYPYTFDWHIDTFVIKGLK